MNRRRFIQSLVAALSIPGNTTMSLRSAASAVPSATAVPTTARFWAVYMSALHGECTPKTLQNLLHIPENDAKNYVARLIADGVIKPNPILQNPVSKIFKKKKDSLIDRAKERLEMRAQANSPELEINKDMVDTAGPVDVSQCSKADSLVDGEAVTEDDALELDTPVEPNVLEQPDRIDIARR